MFALLVHLASAVSKLLSLLACKCLAFSLRHVFPLLSSVWIQACFHPSPLSGNLYFSHFTPPLPLDLSCQVSEYVSHKKSVFPPLSQTSLLLPGCYDSCLVPLELLSASADQQSVALLMSRTPSCSFLLSLFKCCWPFLVLIFSTA